MIDWNYDEDRSRIRTGYGPENITRLRRFAIGVLKSKGRGGVAQKMRQLTRNVRLVFDYLRMSENSCACHLKEAPSENDSASSWTRGSPQRKHDTARNSALSCGEPAPQLKKQKVSHRMP